MNTYQFILYGQPRFYLFYKSQDSLQFQEDTCGEAQGLEIGQRDAIIQKHANVRTNRNKTCVGQGAMSDEVCVMLVRVSLARYRLHMFVLH